ncbi:MAG: hypothetical protein ACHQ9S_07435 [Candidatus Binatia bacterium]
MKNEINETSSPMPPAPGSHHAQCEVASALHELNHDSSEDHQMKHRYPLPSIVIAGVCLVFSAPLHAATVQTLGAGSAVTSIDRSATFDAITSSGIALSDYIEGKLFIGANADSLLGFDPFGGANGSDPYFYCLDGGSMGGGVDSWVTITTTDSAKMFGVEFLYGNSWTGGSPWGNNNAWVTWQTLNGTTVISSGQIGPDPMLPVGTVVGFYDPDGFDRLLVKCNVANQADPNIQALALDNLHVQLTTNLPTATQTPTVTATATPTATQTLPPSATPTAAPIPCTGDCNGNLRVTVDEILTMVNIALGNTPIASCTAGDANGDKQITVDEILTAVNNALNGCARSSAHKGMPSMRSAPLMPGVEAPR